MDVPLSACDGLLMSLKLFLVLPCRLDADLGQLDAHGLTHEIGRREVALKPLRRVIRRLLKVVELVLGLILGDESILGEKLVVLERVLENRRLYV